MSEQVVPAEGDLVIVGGGPAGLSTALFLLQLDPEWADRLIVLEKETHPRPKLCAGGITRFGRRMLEELGLRLSIPYVPISEASLEFGGQSAVFEGDPLFVVTERRTFDAWLADQTRLRGVRLIEGTPARSLAWEEDRVLVETRSGTVRAKAVVCAEGSKGWLGRRAVPQRRSTVARTLEVVVSTSHREREFSEKQARFVFDGTTSHLQGYLWSFPCFHEGQSCINAGIYDSRIISAGARAQLAPMLRDALESHLGLSREQNWESHPIHLFTPQNPLSTERLLLAGDVAGADPLFGEGIAVALGYGKVAARCLQRAFLQGEFSFKDYRRRVIFSDLGKYLLLRWFLAKEIYRRSQSKLFMRFVLHLSQVLATTLSRV